ncbi:hypothetical protein F4559_003835 [Saccharothrix violaceirubra]|uniref:Uncharacterized protein n=1 Tax=Saccharothrix violaceirubra TaxID=413306 RepID=A0A7W7T566_9PSEU|nr:hypothetical protein [Saccharothrix violaceirubra]
MITTPGVAPFRKEALKRELADVDAVPHKAGTTTTEETR